MRRAAVVTISDRCHQRLREDASGPALCALLVGAGWNVAKTSVVPDEIEAIRRAVVELAQDLDLVVTTGGTGLAPRDVTPEAVKPLLDKDIPGLGELMRRSGLEDNKASALSRSLGGTIRACLVLCVPGSPRGASESLAAVLPILPHALEVLSGASKHQETDPLTG